MALNIGLYAQGKDTAHQEPKVKLELVWEKEIPEGTSDIVFLDENGFNVFSSQCKDPEKAIREMRLLLVQDDKIIWLKGDDMKMIKEIKVGEGEPGDGHKIVISKNGRNIASIEGVGRYRLEDFLGGKKIDARVGDFKENLATIKLFNSQGEELQKHRFH
jgi:hypothetical protein